MTPEETTAAFESEEGYWIQVYEDITTYFKQTNNVTSEISEAEYFKAKARCLEKLLNVGLEGFRSIVSNSEAYNVDSFATDKARQTIATITGEKA